MLSKIDFWCESMQFYSANPIILITFSPSKKTSKEAEFVVAYGRRRVGKTFLVNTYFDDKNTFKLTGFAKKGKREQLANFTSSLNTIYKTRG